MLFNEIDNFIELRQKSWRVQKTLSISKRVMDSLIEVVSAIFFTMNA